MNAIDTFLGYVNDTTTNVIHLDEVIKKEESAEVATATTQETSLREEKPTKEPNIKICKACGKPFEAKHALQQYCSRDHYRPCPICGDLIFATYLSDPARRCKTCAHKRNHEDALQTAIDITYSCENGQDKSFATYGGTIEEVKKIEPAISYNDIESNLTFKYVTETRIYRCKEGDGVFIQDEIYTIRCKKGHGCYLALDEEKGIRREFKSMNDFRATFVEVEVIEI